MSESRNRNRRRRWRAGDYIRLAVFVTALCVFLWSGFQLYSIWKEYRTGENEYGQLAEQYVHTLPAQTGTESGNTESGTEAEPAVPVPFSVDFDALKAVNPDNIGWLIMDGTQVNNPVVQGTDNEYYLRHTYLDTWNIAGCLFMDYRNTEKFESRNAIIYGHNQKNEKMFGTLQLYRDPAFYQEHPIFLMYTPEGTLQYQIFSVYETGASSDTFQYSFADDASFQNYLDMVTSRSLYSTGVQVSASDKILTLSTCTDDTVDRFIVHAKRLN